jgi:hypothetical protein
LHALKEHVEQSNSRNRANGEVTDFTGVMPSRPRQDLPPNTIDPVISAA